MPAAPLFTEGRSFHAAAVIFSHPSHAASYVLCRLCGCRSTHDDCRLEVRLAQLVGILGVGFAWYRFVFEPAMLDRPPSALFSEHLAWPYLVPTAVFAALAYLEQLQVQLYNYNRSLQVASSPPSQPS